jgi:hypothetical protein
MLQSFSTHSISQASCDKRWHRKLLYLEKVEFQLNPGNTCQEYLVRGFSNLGKKRKKRFLMKVVSSGITEGYSSWKMTPLIPKEQSPECVV